MGSGYYLGKTKYYGWVVTKDSFKSVEDIIRGYSYTAGCEGGIAPYLLEDKKPTGNSCEVEVTGDIQIVDYSEKSIAVIGDTKPIKDMLASLGGRFNGRLTINDEKRCGWIFQKTKESNVREALNL